MSSRIRYYDIARGITILCVVLGHTIGAVDTISSVGPTWNTVLAFCFSFHMPLFFILSGYFMHPERHFNWKKESKEMLATYALTAAAVIVINTIHVTLIHKGGQKTFMRWVEAAFYGSGGPSNNSLWDTTTYIGAIWFLLALFWAHLFMHLLASSRVAPLWVAILFVVGYFSSSYIWLPLSLQSGMCATTFVYLGWLAKRYSVLDAMRHRPYLWAIPALIWVLAIWQFSGFSVAMNQYGDTPVLTFIGSICGTLCIIGISMLIDHNVPYLSSSLARIGKYTLPILCIHLLEINTAPWVRILDILVNHLGAGWTVLITFIGRTTIDCLLAWALYHIPAVNELFYPSLAKKRANTAATLDKTQNQPLKEAQNGTPPQ